MTLVPLAGWTALILIVATLPAAAIVSVDLSEALGVPRGLLQYPYHLTVFLVLAMLLLRSVTRFGMPTRRAVLVTMLATATVSVASELLQLWTPTRTPAAADVVLDLAGAAIGIRLVRLTGMTLDDP
jgi:VanZ family protein